MWIKEYFKIKLIKNIRNKFNDLSNEIGDIEPIWKNERLSLPKFNVSNNYQKLCIQKEIIKRISDLKYHEEIFSLENN